MSFIKQGLVRILLGLGMIFIAVATLIDKDYVQFVLLKQKMKETT